MTTSSDEEAVGERYVLGPIIGRGAMAEIRVADDLRLARSVAIKLLLPGVAEQPESRLRFAEEARAAARLSHPNVVAIFDTGEHVGRPYIVMELLPGRTLRDEVLDGPFTETRAREVGVHVLRALQAAHESGVIHRDIKPANILLTASGEAKVGDFGIAKGVESTDLTATGLVIGTPSYLAPEVVTGGPATVASDLYAVGVVLYEALSGQKPFAGDSPIAVCHAICTETPQPLPDDVSPELAAVVTRAMAKDPERRFASANEMLRALEGDEIPAVAFVDQPTEPVASVIAGREDMLPSARDVVSRPSRFERVHTGAMALVALVAFLIAVGVVLNLRTHRNDTSTDTQPGDTVATISASSTTTTQRPTTSSANSQSAVAPTVPPASTPTTAPPPTTPPTTTPPTAPTTTAPTTTPPTTTPPTAPPTTAPTTTPPTTAAATG